MEAGGVELGPLVEGGELGLVHDGVFFTQTQPAGIGGGIVSGVLLQDPPLEAVYIYIYVHIHFVIWF